MNVDMCVYNLGITVLSRFCDGNATIMGSISIRGNDMYISFYFLGLVRRKNAIFRHTGHLSISKIRPFMENRVN